jgi:hypothetical protein
MVSKETALDVAAFLDSDEARALELPREHVKRVAELYVGACYDEVGKAPHLVDGHDVHSIVGHVLPGRLKRRDPLAEHVPAILGAYLTHLETSKVVSQAYEQRRALEGTLDEFQEVVRTGQAAHHHHHEKQDPFVHGAPKLGRNDPCSCGSGKKYKKCHGRKD